MRKKILLFVCCALLALVQSPAAAQGKAARAGGGPLARSRQLVLVTTRGWDGVQGTLERFGRKNSKAAWRPVGEKIPVVVGRNGLGWGAGLNAPPRGGPSKKEGDGKSPAGVFRLGPAFGYADASRASWLKVPYTPLADDTECVDDVSSSRYNLIVERSGAGVVDWKSSEQMRAVPGYRWGVVVAHNAQPPVAGRGSCIFLHIWAGPDKGTAGCTAMAQPNLEELLRWLDAKKRPLLVQLPEAEYARLRDAWRLPG
jgi:L,D-peptidoglycan transpeptidase YkuD (ErfK/YbiS/YcfS/YnhG family)